MQLVEQHVIKRSDPRVAVIDAAAFAAKNLYNAANYLVRLSYSHKGICLTYAEVFHRIKQHEGYCALSRKVSKDALRLLDQNRRSFCKSRSAWQAGPSQFLRRPKLPGYKDKRKGCTVLIYDIPALSAPALRRGEIVASQLGITIPTKHTNVRQVRIVPRKGYFMVEVVSERDAVPALVNLAL